MAEKDDREKGLSERVVKEAVGRGMDTSMRDPIVEAVEEADEGTARRRRVPLTGAILGLGAALGYLLGARGRTTGSEGVSIDELVSEEKPETETEAEAEAETEVIEVEDGEEESDGGGSRLRRLFVLLGIAGAVVFLRRRLASSEEEEWEPIEEFEPAVGGEDEGEETEEDSEAEELEMDEPTAGEAEEDDEE